MATNKPRAPAKATAPTPNTPAPATPEKPAEVLATVAAQAATQAITDPAPANSASDDQGEFPLVGESLGEPQDDLVAVAVIVTSRREGFRRAGRAWSKTPTTVPIDELSEDDLQKLHAEPLLSVAYLADVEEKVAG